ncbi:MAG: nicotinate-nucleotide adenylyltransferase [Sphingomonas sp.]|nr:nicotinate-nucleotide adenylyltransferase [Sphingomonas sp.]
MALIGLLGGSFNPAHRGHRRLSLAALRALGLDEVWWLVSPGNPLKAGARDMAPLEARLKSARTQARRAPIRVSDDETRLGTVYTVDTVRRLKALYPQHHFIWLLGSDTLPDFHKWRDWRGLARMVPIAVLPRPGYDRPAQAARAMGWLRRFVHSSGQAINWTLWSAPAIFFLRLPQDPTSATAIRANNPHWHRRPKAIESRPIRSTMPIAKRNRLESTSR